MAVWKNYKTNATSTQLVSARFVGHYKWDRSDTGGVLIRINGVDRWSSFSESWLYFDRTVQFAKGTTNILVEYFHGQVLDLDVTISLTDTEFGIATNASEGGTLTADKSKAIPNTTITLTPTPNAGYRFTGYSDKTPSNLNIASNNTFTMPSQAVSVKANFEKITYNISVAGNPSGGGVATVNKQTGQIGDEITVGHSDNTGYTFKDYTTSPAGLISNGKFTMPANHVTVTANYTHNEYTLSKASNPSAGGSVTLSQDKAYYNDEITVTATPATGYRFVRWETSPSVTITNGTFNMPNGNISITAVFEKIPRGITYEVNPENSGLISSDYGGTAEYGDVVTLSYTEQNGYLFDSYSSEDVTIVDGKFTMPNKSVTIVGNFYPGRSTGTLDKDTYTGGETAVLTISAERSFFTHKYRLNFGPGMDTGFVNVPTGVYEVDIYIPLEWSKVLMSTPKTGGVLTLQTYNGNTLTGEYEITDLSYAALNGTIPKLILSRAKESGAYKLDGVRATYEIAVPSGITSHRLIYGNESATDPESTGFVMPESKKLIPLERSDIVTLEITYGQETFSVMESVPAVVIINKNVNPES